MSKRFQGQVVSDKMQKTIVVEVKHRKPHPLYGKVLEKRTRLYAHDKDEQAQMGDRVEIEETRPLSKLKRFKLVKIIDSK
jgi:small subunit ribosomal protein S17